MIQLLRSKGMGIKQIAKEVRVDLELLIESFGVMKIVKILFSIYVLFFL